MKPKVPCPVCRNAFISQQAIGIGDEIRCRICGAKLVILGVCPEVTSDKAAQEPAEEIADRIESFAELKGYAFNDNRDLVVEGLLQKKMMYGDFFCPCRFENTADNICPCLDTRQGRVRKDGQCRCGLFVAPDSNLMPGN